MTIVDVSWADSANAKYIRKYPKIAQNSANTVGVVNVPHLRLECRFLSLLHP